MNIRIIKPCDMRRGGAIQNLQVDALLNLPDDKAQQLIDAGYAKPEPFDALHWIEEMRRMVAAFDREDPRGGCWQFIATNRPELLRANRAALKEVDDVFEAQDSPRISEAMQRAQDSFTACLEAWETRDKFKQPALLAAGNGGQR